MSQGVACYGQNLVSQCDEYKSTLQCEKQNQHHNLMSWNQHGNVMNK